MVFIGDLIGVIAVLDVPVGLVVDFGWSEVRVGVVYEGAVGEVGFVGVGMKDVDWWVEEQVGLGDDDSLGGEDVRAGCCAAFEEGVEVEDVELGGGKVVSGQVRRNAVLCLFGKQQGREDCNVCETICQVLRRCSVVQRPDLIKNVILIGGGAMMPGIGRLLVKVIHDIQSFLHV